MNDNRMNQQNISIHKFSDIEGRMHTLDAVGKRCWLNKTQKHFKTDKNESIFHHIIIEVKMNLKTESKSESVNFLNEKTDIN